MSPAVEVFDETAGLVHVFVIRAGVFSVALGRNDTGLARFPQRFDDALVGIEGFVGEQSIGFHVRQQRVCPLQVMGLAWGQEEAEWIAESVDQGMDLGAQSAFAAPNRLMFVVFFWAPALC